MTRDKCKPTFMKETREKKEGGGGGGERERDE